MDFIIEDSDLKLGQNISAVYFYASWMPFHKKMVKMINKIEEERKITFLAIDANYFKSLCKRYKIESVPTIVIFNNGKEVKRVVGLILTSALRSIFIDICKNKEINDEKSI